LQWLKGCLSDPNFSLVEGDLQDAASLHRLIKLIRPMEVYNLAAMSHVRSSFEMAEYTLWVNALGTMSLLEAIRLHHPTAKFYQASTSELYGYVQETPQSETTPFYPRSPYAVSKLCAFWSVKNYREAYKIYACNGILFNHESPRRGEHFVTRKITLAASRIKQGLQDCLIVGNLNAQRDWGYAPDFVKGMWQMLQCDEPQDFVLATGNTHTVREFTEKAFAHVGIFLEWEGQEENERGVERGTGRTLVAVSKEFYRPTEVDLLIGNATKAHQKLKWESTTSFEELVSIMMDADMEKTKEALQVESTRCVCALDC
jgi:GDPmannose 4,6-dehydratase